MTADLSTSNFDFLLDEVLFELHKNDVNDPDEADLILDRVVSKVARALELRPSPEDSKAVAALAYEQIRGYQP